MKSKGFKSPLKIALWLCLAALLGSVLLFPEIFWYRGVSFFTWSDYLVDYQSTFALTGFFYQGGIQLWDFFGQLPHAYFWMTHGMFHLPNILTAIVYVLFSPFADNSARFFDRVFSIVYSGSLLCIRTIGIFLLLRRLTDDKWILRLGTVTFALLFAPPAFLLGTFYQSYYPLLMYFILSFFLTWRLLYLGMSLLFLLLSFSQGIIHTCYMYLGINMFIVSCGVYSLMTQRSIISRCRKFFIKNAKVIAAGTVGLLGLAAVILGPYFYMQLFCLKDVAFDAEHSRLSGMWSAARYFHGLMLDQTPPADFFRRMLDFTSLPGDSFFLGYMIFFLSGLGLTLSSDRRKWIFVLTILLVWFINFPQGIFSIGLIGHWVNFLTNPLKTIVRSYQTASNSIIVYLFMPLAVMGLGVLKSLGRGVVFPPKRLPGLVVFMVIFAINGCSYQPAIVKIYFIAAMILSLTALALMVLVKRHVLIRRLANATFICLILVDVCLNIWDIKHYLAAGTLRPHFLEVFPAQAGTVGLDFHNPKIFPFVGRTDMFSVTDQSYLWTLRDMSFNFNGVIDRETAFVKIEGHSPRHMAYQEWVNDPAMWNFVTQNDQLFYFAPYAVKQGPGTFEEIVRRGLSKDVLMVEGNEPSLKADIPSQIVPLSQGEDQWLSIHADINDDEAGWVYEKNLVIWEMPIPPGSIPGYFASNIFTHDRWVRFFIQTPDQKFTELAPVQGQLLRPMTFDVQNIKEGKVFVALPANTSFVGFKGVLLLKMRDASGITSVWLHHSDETGINFQAPANGWLGIQFPYDPKWRIEVDGKPVHFYRMNKSFIGLPMTQGEHKVLVRYWPGSWLRWGLPLSAILTSVLFIVLIIYALQDASSLQNDPLSTHE